MEHVGSAGEKFFGMILLFSVFAGSIFCCIQVSRASYSSSQDSLFKVVEWPSEDANPLGYTIVSDQVFPLTVYVVSLPEVGGVFLSNHSAVVDGVLKAVEITPREQVKHVNIALAGNDLAANIKVNVSCVLVQDWKTYESVIEQGNSTIVVNTHDQYFPIPSGYTREEWVDKLSDFMLNRWGTWVHIGGYPFYSVWYENGTTSEWGAAGYARLLSHITEANVTCYSSGQSNIFSDTDLTNVLKSWWLLPTKQETAVGYPIRLDDFNGNMIMPMYGGGKEFHAAMLFAQNRSSFNFGIYVHLGTSDFYGGFGGGGQPGFIAGYVPTATAIYSEYSYSMSELYGLYGESASELIQKAINEGRTVGLEAAKALFQKALASYAAGNYKIARSYASQAATLATSSSRPVNVPLLVSGVFSACLGIVIIRTGVHPKRKQKDL